MWKGHFIFGEILDIYPIESKFLVAGYCNNNVHFEGVRFICVKVRVANESYARKMTIITIITHCCEFTST